MNNQKILLMYYNNEIKYLTNSNMDHLEWFLSLGGNKSLYDNLIRGFVMDGKIVFFKGQDFKYDQEVFDVARNNGLSIRRKLNNNNLIVCCGILPGFPGQKWEPIMILNDNELIDHEKKEEPSKNNFSKDFQEGPILELKNDYNDENFIKTATILTIVTLILCILAKIILIARKQLNTSNFFEIFLVVIQIGSLIVTLYGYKTKKDYTKYLSIVAAIALVFSFDLIDIIIGIIYFVFSVDQNYFKELISAINKRKDKIIKKYVMLWMN